MSTRVSRLVAGAASGFLWCLLAACGDNLVVGTDAGGPPSTTRPVFNPPVEHQGAAWGAIPFPSDLYLDANGFVALNDIPIGPNADPAFSGLMLDRVHEMRGAGVWSNVFFPMSGNVDGTTLAGNVKVVDLADMSEIPVDPVFRADLDVVVAALAIGRILRQDHVYAAYVTSGVRGVDGRRLGAPDGFREAIDLSRTPADPALANAQNVLRPLLEALPTETVATLVSATVFTTENVTDIGQAIRDVVTNLTPTVSGVVAHTDLATYFGVQAANAAPGIASDDSGQAIGRGQPHGNVATLIHGNISLPNFLNATTGEAGLVELDQNGVPIIKGQALVRFTLILPDRASYANLPVMIFMHPFTRTRADMLLHADVAAARGIATIAIDHPYHGDRYPGASDVDNQIVGTSGPDGFGDANFLSATRFLQLQASGGIPAKHTGVIRDNVRQAVADISSLVSFLDNGNLAPVNTALANVGLPTNLSFDPNIALTGDSLGAMLATVVVALEPRIPIAFVNVSPGGLPFPSFLHSPAFSELVTGVLITPLDIDSRIILGDPVADVRFDPMVMLLDNVIEAGDPQSFAPYLLAGELRGGSRPHIALNEAWEDEWVPNIATEGLAAAMDLPFFRLNLPEPPPVDPWLRFVTLPEVAGPSVAGNLDSGAQTAAFILWHPATHGLSYWYEDVLKMEPDFPPFVMLPSPTRLNNPTLEIQTLRASFFADFFAGLTPALVDPY